MSLSRQVVGGLKQRNLDLGLDLNIKFNLLSRLHVTKHGPSATLVMWAPARARATVHVSANGYSNTGLSAVASIDKLNLKT